MKWRVILICINYQGGQQEDNLRIQNLGLNVDDENEAVVENVPVSGEVVIPTN